MKNPLFLCGPANCGTNLVKAILGVNDKIHLESEPFLPIFQFLRTEILKQKYDNKKKINYSDPLFEYYFSKTNLEIMKVIQNSNLKIKINQNKIIHLKKLILKRMNDYVPHLKKDIDEIKGLNFKEIFDNAISLIEKNHEKKNIKWIGWLDSWIEEFFPILANSYPGSKFVLIIRDPRAAISSSNTHFKKKKINHLAPLTLSYLRCWRKQIAMTEYFNSKKNLRSRFISIKYEDLVKNPKIVTKRLCKFLSVKYSDKMINSNNFMGLGLNKKWVPNSNYNTNQKGIYKTSLNKWKKFLKPDVRNFIEVIVGIELKYLGYIRKLNKIEKSKILKFHIKDFKNSKGWRTSGTSPKKDINLEISRYDYLKLNKISVEDTKKNFLFQEALLAFQSKLI